jgi:hypothetical protein
MSLTNFSGGRDAALRRPVRQDGTNVVMARFPSPDAALGDGDSAARLSPTWKVCELHNPGFWGKMAVFLENGAKTNGPGCILKVSGRVLKGSGRILKSSGRILKGSGRYLKGSGRILEGSGRVLEGSGRVLEGSGRVLKGPGRVLKGSGRYLKGSGRYLRGSG